MIVGGYFNVSTIFPIVPLTCPILVVLIMGLFSH